MQNAFHFLEYYLCLISNSYKNIRCEKFYPYVVSYPYLGNLGNIFAKKQPGSINFFSAIKATRLSFLFKQFTGQPFEKFYWILFHFKLINYSTSQLIQRPVAFRLPIRNLCKTSPFAQFLRHAQILIFEILNVCLGLKFSRSLNLNKNEHFPKVAMVRDLAFS